MESQLERNKAIVLRFNRECIEQGNIDSFNELLDERFINHTAIAGVNNGPEGMVHVIVHILRRAFPDLKVIIYDQVAEGNLVTTRKTIKGTHTGPLMDIPPTNRAVNIDVIDIVRIKDDKYYEHWGINTLPVVIAQLSKSN